MKKLKIKVSSDAKKLAKYENIIMPKDYRCLNLTTPGQVLSSDLPLNQNLYEIGQGTVEDYLELIRKAKTIVIKGPLGKVEDKNFQEATKAILGEIEKSSAFTFVIGRSTVNCFKQLDISMKNIKHLSKNTQPLLTYLIDEKLPTIEVLRTK